MNARPVVKMRLVGEAWPDGVPLLRNEVHPQGNGSPRERRALVTSQTAFWPLCGEGARGEGKCGAASPAGVLLCGFVEQTGLPAERHWYCPCPGWEWEVEEKPPAGCAIIKAMCR